MRNTAFEAPFAINYAARVNEFQPLIDQLYREEILRARTMTPALRIEAAFALAPLARHGEALKARFIP